MSCGNCAPRRPATAETQDRRAAAAAKQELASALPDGRRISLVFGRVQHRLPGFQLRMLDFKMLSYDHRGSPRDYQTLVRVESTDGSFESYDEFAAAAQKTANAFGGRVRQFTVAHRVWTPVGGDPL